MNVFTMLKRGRGICTILLGFLAVAALSLILSHYGASAAIPAERNDPVRFTAEYYAAVNERFGVGLNTGITVSVDGAVRPALVTDYDVGALHIGWYSDWMTSGWTSDRQPLRPGGIEYAQLITVRAAHYPTNTLLLTETIAANPGALWIIGNEPEAKYNQGNRTPDEYAGIYHDMYMLIKGTESEPGLDPTAWIAIGGVIEPTPLRLQWLEMVLAEYENRYGQEMPVDVWNTHVQILQEKAGDFGAEIPAGIDATEGELYDYFSLETGYYDNANPVIFRRLVTEFRQWMKDKGFQNKPLIISEYGVLLPSTYIGYGDGYGDEDFGDQVLKDFMRETFDFLVNAKDPDLGYPADDNRLVQQWLWYSLNDRPYHYDPITGTAAGFNGSLFDYRDPTKLTEFGEYFRYYMYRLLGLPRIWLPVITRRVSPS